MSDVYMPKGRPSALTDAVADRLVELIESGHYNRTAAQGAGIGARSFQRWLARGQEADERLNSGQPIDEQDERCWHLWQRIQQAEGRAVSEALAAIRQGWQRDNQWTAAAWYLERKYPGEWGRRQEVQIGPNDRMLEVLAQAITVGGEEDTEPGTTVTPLAPELEPPA
jgi:hypothetical protein